MNEWFSIWRYRLAFQAPTFVGWIYTTRAEAVGLAQGFTFTMSGGLVLQDRQRNFVIPPRFGP